MFTWACFAVAILLHTGIFFSQFLSQHKCRLMRSKIVLEIVRSLADEIWQTGLLGIRCNLLCSWRRLVWSSELSVEDTWAVMHRVVSVSMWPVVNWARLAAYMRVVIYLSVSVLTCFVRLGVCGLRSMPVVDWSAQCSIHCLIRSTVSQTGLPWQRLMTARMHVTTTSRLFMCVC